MGLTLKALSLATLLSISGCASPEPSNGEGSSTGATPEEPKYAPERLQILEYYQSVGFGTDLTLINPLGLCDAATNSTPTQDKYYINRNFNSRISPNHTKIIFEVDVGNMFSEYNLTSLRIGAYYNDSLVFWTGFIQESTTIEYHFGGNMPDIDKSTRWEFYKKLADQTSGPDDNACTSGFQSGHYGIDIYSE